MESKPEHLLLHAPLDREKLLTLAEEHAGSVPWMDREILRPTPQLGKEKCPEGRATKPSPFLSPRKLRTLNRSLAHTCKPAVPF